MADPLGALPCEVVPLTHFVGRDIGEPDAADAAELSRLIAASTRPANVAFLSALVPKDLDGDDAAELQALAGVAKRARSAAALSPLLPAETTETGADIAEAHALANLCEPRRNASALAAALAARRALRRRRDDAASGRRLRERACRVPCQ